MPSIGFRQTGLEDVIYHKKTGYIANYMDQNDFNTGLNWIIGKITEDKNFFHSSCINFTKGNFSEDIVVNKYLKIYREILNNEI